jgi:hypothetical protein
MNMRSITRLPVFLVALFGLLLPTLGISAGEVAILSGEDLNKVVPTGFYYEGLAAPTQMRNSAAVRFGAKHYVIVALVDTSGYATSVRERYEGFFITDSKVRVGQAEVAPGAYGFGFSSDSKMNIFDVGGNQLHSVVAAKDSELTAPRPLAFVKSGDDLRLYHGRNFVVIKEK